MRVSGSISSDPADKWGSFQLEKGRTKRRTRGRWTATFKLESQSAGRSQAAEFVVPVSIRKWIYPSKAQSRVAETTGNEASEKL